MEQKSPLLTGIDIGTAEVRVVMAREDQENGQLTVVATGRARSRGLRKGSVIQPSETAAAVGEAVQMAEARAGEEIQTAVINVNGGHVSGNTSKGIIAINTPNKEITAEEVQRVRDAAMVVNLPPNREILHVFSKDYRVDGQSGVHNPVGMQGVRLEVDAHVVTASTPAIKHLEQIFESLDIQVMDRALSSIGGFRAVMAPEQIENGSVLVDIGASTTNIAVIEEGDLMHVAVIPVGGVNVTNDLAIGLQTELSVAEALKLQYSPHDNPALNTGNVRVKVGRKDFIFERANVEMIMRARMEELFELIDDELVKIERSGRLPGGVVLVGGASQLHGIDQIAREILKLPARLGVPGDGFMGLKEELARTDFVTATGLMLQHYKLFIDGYDMGGSKRKMPSFSGVGGSMKGAGKAASKGVGVIKNLASKFKP